MLQKAILAFCTCLVFNSVYTQTGDIQTILQEIEHNNVELSTFDKYIEGQSLTLKSGNVLPNPEIGSYFLPFGNGNYTEIQISQSFEFPTVYSTRKALIGSQEEQLRLEYNQKRQQIILASKISIQEVIALNKLKNVEQKRLDQAKILFDQNKALFEKGEIGILELNKAKVIYIKWKFKLQQIQTDKENALLELKKLNGGNPIELSQAYFENDFLLPKRDSILQEKFAESAVIQFYRQAENVADHQVKLNNAKRLPDFSVGYNYQGFTGDLVSGFFAGVSIPIWGNKIRNKAAQTLSSYSKSNTSTQVHSIVHDFDIQYNKHQALLQVYTDYHSTLQILNSETLLLKAYRLGEISFSEYYIELEFYHSAHDSLLEMEKQLHLLKTQILSHQL